MPREEKGQPETCLVLRRQPPLFSCAGTLSIKGGLHAQQRIPGKKTSGIQGISRQARVPDDLGNVGDLKLNHP